MSTNLLGYKLRIPHNKKEYEYNLEIGNIKKALVLNWDRSHLLRDNPYLDKTTKRRLSRLSHDFSMLAKKLIAKKQIETYEDYQSVLSALSLANSEIEILLARVEGQNKSYRKFLRKCKKNRARKQRWREITGLLLPHGVATALAKQYVFWVVLFIAVPFYTVAIGAALISKGFMRYYYLSVLLFYTVFAVVNRRVLTTSFQISKQLRAKYRRSYRYYSNESTLKWIANSLLNR